MNFITCQSEWDRLQECEFPFSWGALQDYCCETCAPHVDYEPKNMTTVRVWGIGAYLDDLELVEVGSIDPFSYCILSPDVTVEEIVASGNYLHVAVKACHNIYTMTISDVEINRITTTGSNIFCLKFFKIRISVVCQFKEILDQIYVNLKKSLNFVEKVIWTLNLYLFVC